MGERLQPNPKVDRDIVQFAWYVPTVSDRIGQEVVRRYLEPLLEPMFHADSYGYRPWRSAIDAIRTARQRCWRYDWIVDIDIKGFFDSIDHALLLRAVRKHTDCPWVLLYIERWLKAPAMMGDGTLVLRDRGTPQGGVISPLLANLFLHYVFDVWLHRAVRGVPFERYADDIICHCRSEHDALKLRQTLDQRFAECGLVLHPEKTKVVYCKDAHRKGEHATIQFDFLGYTFRPRLAKWQEGLYGVSFLPAASPKALKEIRRAVRGWSLQTRSDKGLDDLARMFNPYVRGWINYYGHFYKSALYPTLMRIDAFLVRWARRKFRRLRGKPRGARDWLLRVIRTSPGLFAHWKLLYGSGRTLGAV